MIIIEFKDATDYCFELKNKEREMDFCIEMGIKRKLGVSATFTVTNVFGIKRSIKTDSVQSCVYKPKFTFQEKEKV
jgi:hypothetical protein